MHGSVYIDEDGIMWSSQQLAKLVQSFGEAPQREDAPADCVWMPAWLVRLMVQVVPPKEGDITVREEGSE